VLQVRKLSRFFGGLAAITDLDIDVVDSEILGVIGPNGAGKTTLFNVISGFLPPTRGEVILDGQDITLLKAHEIAQRGMSRIFQTSTLFMSLSVLENVFTGYHLSYRSPVWKRLLRAPSALSEEADLRSKAMEIIDFMGLGLLKHEIAANLPHGHQRILGICIALAAEPKLLLLDEPVTGMNQTEIQTMIDLILRIRERGVTIMIVEHNMKAVMGLCDRVVALNYGVKIAEGVPKEIMENRDVIEAYLGKETGEHAA
jgi:branched-chain amino acid transport system ATP-binding protein